MDGCRMARSTLSTRTVKSQASACQTRSLPPQNRSKTIARCGKTSFARDQRASFIQNHDHDCTATCVKYLKKKNARELPQRAGQKIAGPGVPKCRFRFFRYVAIQKEAMLKYVVRRGKELVKRAFIATGDEENEYGKAMVPRQAPFKLTSSDVLQSTLRCNAYYQYQTRAVPVLQTLAEAEHQYQMRAELAVQRQMTAGTDKQYPKTDTAGDFCYRGKAEPSLPGLDSIPLVRLRCL